MLAAPLEKLAPLRCGIIGLGTMGRKHAEALRTHPYFTLAGVTSATPRKDASAEFDCRWFDSAEQMVHSGVVDVVVIATPHWQHAELAVTALRAGLHVACEKPLAVTVAQADAVLRDAKAGNALLTCVFQSRFEPAYQHVKALLASGELGPVSRCEMDETFWRSDAYYRSNSWRGTWKGEGGGVLVNQAPHVLDRYGWLCGMPERIMGFCDSALHEIEVEDSASALFRHADGMHGHLHVSTNECPWMSRTLIACDRGRILIENGHVRVSRLRESIRERTAATTHLMGDIECDTRDTGATPITSVSVLLSRFYENFALAIAGKQPLLVTPEQAAASVELANAILLSAARGETVSLPVKRKDYDAFLAAKTGATR
jgi:predicted dehydrogenase